MNFDFLFGCNSFLDQKKSYGFAIISLKLDNLTPFFVIDYSTIATP